MERWDPIRAADVGEVVQTNYFLCCIRLVDYGIAPNAMLVKTPCDRQSSRAVHSLVLKNHSAGLNMMPGCSASSTLLERRVLGRRYYDRGLKCSAYDESIPGVTQVEFIVSL